MIWSPLAGGLLSGKYNRDNIRNVEGRFANGWDEPPVEDSHRLWNIVDVLNEIASRKCIAETTDFKTFKDLGHFNEGPMKTTNFSSPKHGAIITITKDQADKLEKYWSDKVSVHVDLTKPIEPMKPLWAWFGYDEPNYTYMKDGKRLLVTYP